MSQVTIEVNGRPYTVGCEDGQEQHLVELAKHFDRHVRQVSQEVGQLGEARLFLMGHSAGAQIAVLLALDQEYLQQVGGDDRWLRGVVGLSGPYDFLPLRDETLKTLNEIVTGAAASGAGSGVARPDGARHAS